MKFVLAPDKFKGSLTGHEFCDAAEEGVQIIFPNATIIKKPLADGGDGTIDVVKDYLNATVVKTKVSDPLFRPTVAQYLFSEEKKVAYIEMSEASGYKLLKKEELNCMNTTSLGTGQLIADAIAKGAKEIILGIGGSATNDGGMGMAQALGFQFLDENKNILKPIGSNLNKVHKIKCAKTNQFLKGILFKVACDVTNPLYGQNGAAHVYGQQKGASQEEILFLDKGLKNFAEIIKARFSLDVQRMPGTGAAGGMGAGAIAFLNARLVSGIELIKGLSNFDEAIKDADWVITGEGKLDDQTTAGKTITGVLKSANLKGIPVAALCGTVEISDKGKNKLGLTYFASVSKDVSDMELAMKSAYSNVTKAATELAKIIKNNELQFFN